MLIIARRKGQRIVIAGGIEVVVTEVTRGSVKLGIVAPAQTTILRGELHDAVQTANREAAEIAGEGMSLPPLASGAVTWGKPT